MRTILRLCLLVCCCLLTASLSSCYHMGGTKPPRMKHMNTYCVHMFENHSTQPQAGMLLTSALGDAMQRDGTYKPAPQSSADFILKGEITGISYESLMTDSNDSYISREVGISMHVTYSVIEAKTGKTLYLRSTSARSSAYTSAGSYRNSAENALSSVARKVAENMVNQLTIF